MNKVAAFALRRKNSILSMSEKMFCPPQPLRFWITPACAGKRRSDWIIRSIYWDHPAYAGKSRSQPRLPCTGRDHPRVCGEKRAGLAGERSGLGSPPRMRGKEPLKLRPAGAAGITPAHAGKSCTCVRCPADRWDHPRVCEEKHLSGTTDNRPHGSPLRMRGKENLTIAGLEDVGITPACAGKRLPYR